MVERELKLLRERIIEEINSFRSINRLNINENLRIFSVMKNLENLKETTTKVLNKIMQGDSKAKSILEEIINIWYEVYSRVIHNPSIKDLFKEKICKGVINFIRGIGRVCLGMEEFFSEKEIMNLFNYIIIHFEYMEKSARKEGFYKIAEKSAKAQEVLFQELRDNFKNYLSSKGLITLKYN
ncbi:MAG: hypothetical protein QXW71_00425 [Thermoplasmata archaeon]